MTCLNLWAAALCLLDMRDSHHERQLVSLHELAGFGSGLKERRLRRIGWGSISVKNTGGNYQCVPC